ncbi:PREDICTED: uncharacterized protein LOC108567300 [Nicrophorus vespilloides]|uniref:Uncharacterized protein LOC108567300 n=1 Tax=Nicrophorus vespilloides TaxID=110193 RepID=A0ABM1N8L1_NICVS|nr:PREDICTED: uncharacterized protein LOC108567300 [Nicrophorus vespilloides]
MFKQIFVVLAICATFGFAELEQVFDRQGQEFYLIPAEEYNLVRHRRRAERIPTDHNIRGKLYGRDDPNYGEVYGGRATYTHRPSDSQFSVGGERRQRGGSKIDAKGQYNFFETNDGRGTIGIGGQVSRTNDGRGHHRTDYGALLEGEYRF